MRQILLIIGLVALVGCRKKEPVQPNMPNPSPTAPTKSNPEAINTDADMPESSKAKITVGVKLWEFTPGNATTSTAIGSDGMVYIGGGSNDNCFVAINGKTGVKSWEFETGANLFDTSPAIGADGTVYVGSRDKKIYAINGETGAKLWEFETDGWVETSPAISSDGTIYVASMDNKLYAIKTNSKGPAKSSWPMRGQNAQRTGRAQ